MARGKVCARRRRRPEARQWPCVITFSAGGLSMQFTIWTARALILALVAAGISAVAGADPLKVKTEQGQIHGKLLNSGEGENKVRAFLGIPYAAPPIGELRWKAPQHAAKWKGVRDATNFGAHCAQNHVF